MRGNYSSKAFYRRDRQLKAEAPASPVMRMPLPPRAGVNRGTPTPKYRPEPRVIVMRIRESRSDGVEVWGPEAA